MILDRKLIKYLFFFEIITKSQKNAPSFLSELSFIISEKCVCFHR